jgi:hypothetical protein
MFWCAENYAPISSARHLVVIMLLMTAEWVTSDV